MFQLGQEVQYKDQKGIVDFVDASYVGICVKQCDNRLHCIRLIVYPDQWEEVIINTDRT
jgi:hypothetical protein